MPTVIGELARKAGAENLVTCVYQTQISGSPRHVTITWVKGQGLCVSVDGDGERPCRYTCKVRRVKPWSLWRRRHGSKALEIGGGGMWVEVFWDLRGAKYVCGPEPKEGFYVAVVWDGEIALLLGDMCKEALRKTGARMSATEASLISRKEHVFGKKQFCTKAMFEDGKAHDIIITCEDTLVNADNTTTTTTTSSSSSSSSYASSAASSSSSSLSKKGKVKVKDTCLTVKVDKQVVLLIQRLAWKFRGNDTFFVDSNAVDIFWDVHNWVFDGGVEAGAQPPGHATFIFQASTSAHEKPLSKKWSGSLSYHPLPRAPTSPRTPPAQRGEQHQPKTNAAHNGHSSLLLYAWKCD